MNEEQKKRQNTSLLNSEPVDRAFAVRLGGLTSEQHAAALIDKNWLVRYAAIQQGNLTPEQLQVARNDAEGYVRSGVLKSTYTLPSTVSLIDMTNEEYNAALADITKWVLEAATFSSPGFVHPGEAFSKLDEWGQLITALESTRFYERYDAERLALYPKHNALVAEGN